MQKTKHKVSANRAHVRYVDSICKSHKVMIKNGSFMTRTNVQYEKYVIKVIEKAIRLLDSYSKSQSTLTLSELAKMTGFDKATVFRIMRTMEKNGYVLYDRQDRTYRLGPRFLELGKIVDEGAASEIKLDQLQSKTKKSLFRFWASGC